MKTVRRLTIDTPKTGARKTAVGLMGAGLIVAVLAGCETTPVAPVVTPTPQATPMPAPVEPEPYEAWMGPKPRAVPVETVSRSGLSPVTQPVGPAPATAATSSSPALPIDEPADIRGITIEHADIMLGRGDPPFGWSSELANSAGLQAAQMAYSMCDRSARQDFSAPGEAIRIEPPGSGPDGARPAHLSARHIVRDWAGAGMGPFGADNPNVSRLGCAVQACLNSSQIIVCRYG